jgi:chromosome segregation ATPase
MQTTFTRAYREGRKLYLLRVEVANIEAAIAQSEQRLEAVNAEIVSSATRQLDPLLAPADRIELAAHTHRLTEERHRLQHEIPALVDELDDKQAELDRLRQALAGVVY